MPGTEGKVEAARRRSERLACIRLRYAINTHLEDQDIATPATIGAAAGHRRSRFRLFGVSLVSCSACQRVPRWSRALHAFDTLRRLSSDRGEFHCSEGLPCRR
jgi:hypothetical protein